MNESRITSPTPTSDVVHRGEMEAAMQEMALAVAQRAADEAVNKVVAQGRAMRTSREKTVSRRRKALAWMLAMLVVCAESAVLTAKMSTANHLWCSFGVILMGVAAFSLWWAVDDETTS